MAVKAKRLEFAASLDRAGRLSAEGGAPLALDDALTPEHLVLVALLQCSLASLRYHASPQGMDFVATASASGVVTRRDEDGRYAFVEIDARFDVELEPAPPGDEVAALVARAERDCFISASLRVEPRYAWRVNGRELA